MVGRMKTLWLVTIHEDDWDYDRFVSAVVWAETADEAERIMRSHVHTPKGTWSWQTEDKLWIEDPAWRLSVEPAPAEGVAHLHWHAG